MEINTGILLSFVFSIITICFLVPYSIEKYQKNKDMIEVFGMLTLIFGILAILMFIFACFEIESFSEAKEMFNEILHIIINKTIKVFTN